MEDTTHCYQLHTYYTLHLCHLILHYCLPSNKHINSSCWCCQQSTVWPDLCCQQHAWPSIDFVWRGTNVIICKSVQDDTHVSRTFLHCSLNAGLTGTDQWLECLYRLIKQLDEQRTGLLVLIAADCWYLSHTSSHTNSHVIASLVNVSVLRCLTQCRQKCVYYYHFHH